MGRIVVAVFVIGSVLAAVLAAEEQGGGSARGQRPNACALLTRPLMEKVAPGRVSKLVFEMKPQEEPVGPSGSACEYATTGLQLDPFARSEEMRRNSPGRDWQRLSGVGDTAYFRDNANRWAELIVWTGAHHFTIQMGVPDGSTAEAIKPNVVMLAQAIIPQLK